MTTATLPAACPDCDRYLYNQYSCKCPTWVVDPSPVVHCYRCGDDCTGEFRAKDCDGDQRDACWSCYVDWAGMVSGC